MIPSIDVSQFQGVIDWAAVKATGITGVIIRATDGAHYDDTTFDANIAGAHTHGMAIVVYHFARRLDGAVTQAQHCIARVAATGVPIVRYMLDLEQNPPGPLPLHWLDDMLVTFDSAAPNRCALYSAAYWWNPSVTNPAKYADRLFVAAEYPTRVPPPLNPGEWLGWAYTVHPTGPGTPAGFTKAAGWQFSDLGAVAGVGHPPVDCDLIDPAFFVPDRKELPVAYLIKRASDPEVDITDGIVRRRVTPEEYAFWQPILGPERLIADAAWNAIPVYTAPVAAAPYPTHITGTLS